MKKFLPFISMFILSAASLLTGCTSQQGYPPINYSSTRDYDYGQVVWRDLVTPDPKGAAQFYKTVFGWTASQAGTDETPYWIFKSNGKPVAGMYLMSDAIKDAGGEWVQYFSVSSLDDFIAKSKAVGGNVLVKPTELQGRGKVALLSDNQNAYFAIIKSSTGDPSSSMALEFQFLWSELWSNDMQKSSEYYKSIFNSQLEEKKDDERPYILIKNNGKLSSGIIKNPAENVRSNWVQYVRVADVKTTEQNVRNAGGKIIIASDSAIRKGSVSVFLDPSGAPLGIQKWPIE